MKMKRIGPVSMRYWKTSLGTLAVIGALSAGPTAAQDFTAGKTTAQLFQSDCSACHKSPAGLAKGMDARSLAGFLREHYTTKEETAAALAAYVAGSGSGSALADPKQRGGPKAKPDGNPEPKPEARPTTAEREPAQKPKPRATAATEPGQGEGDTPIMREETSRRARAAAREDARSASRESDAIESKLKAYGAAGGPPKETERLADHAKKVESYVNSGAPAEAVPPAEPKDPAPASAEPGAANAAAVPADEPNTPHKRKKKKDAAPTDAGDTPGARARPRRAQAPVSRPLPGNN
jgi:hypothetical protein